MPQPQQHMVVAVAGGTGGVGKTIVQQLQLHQDRFQIIVLTRNEPTSYGIHAPGTEYVKADYSTANIDNLAELLVRHQVQTVISTITINEGTSDAQMNLIRAAIKAKEDDGGGGGGGVMEWFVPSEFGYVNVEEIIPLDPSVKLWIAAAELLASSPLQYTRIANGFFLDYLGMPHVETNMRPFTWVMDIYGRRAAIPGDGTQLISLTHTVDVARYVVKLLDLASNGEKWDEWSIVVGEDISFNEVLEIAERVRPGGEKFQVTHDTLEALESGKATVLPLPGETAVDPSSHMDGEAEAEAGAVEETCALFGRLYLYGVLCMPRENRFSDRFRDEIRPLGVEEFLVDAWTGH